MGVVWMLTSYHWFVSMTCRMSSHVKEVMSHLPRI